MARISTKTGIRHAIRPGREGRQGRKQPGANKRKFPSPTAAVDRVERMIELADRIAAGKVKPARIARLSSEDAIMILLSLRYSGNLAAVSEATIEGLFDRFHEGDEWRRKPTS